MPNSCMHAFLVVSVLLSVADVSTARLWPDDVVSINGNGVVVPLYMRQGDRARGLLRSGSLPVLGAVREVGYFYANIMLGTPSRKFAVIIDTGSTVTYVPCSTCKHCGVHEDEAFDLKSSSTVTSVGCDDEDCDCGSPACSCQNDKCYYFRSYAEKSTSEGWLVKDKYVFPDNSGPSVPLVFGCENGETGEIFRQKADGILGMGNNNIAFQSQLVKGNVIEDVFALCFAWPSGGAMTLGDVPIPSDLHMIYTPLVVRDGHQHYYNVKLDEIAVNGQPLPINRAAFDVGYGTVVDSGTTFTYLPTAAYKPFQQSIDKFALKAGLRRAGGIDPKYKDVCWEGGPAKFEDLGDTFPTVEFVFDGDARMSMPPYRYLFLLKSGTYCLGIFDNGKSGILIGGISVRNLLIQYDRRNDRIGWGETECSTMLASYRKRSKA